MFITKIGSLALGVASLALCAAAAPMPAQHPLLPQSTAIPVRFEHSIDAKKAKAGDAVTAKTMQVVVLPNGNRLPKGAVLSGHVVAAEPFQFDSTPYAHQSSSVLSIHFDNLRQGDAVIPVHVSVRAIANAIQSRDAMYPHSTDDTDHVGVITLIGGLSFSPLSKAIESDGGDAIAYNRKDGVFARLIASANSGAGTSVHCAATETEQSVAIFAPDACGLYGFAGDSLTANGQDGSGTFTLAVRGHSAKLYAGSAALLQVIPAQ